MKQAITDKEVIRQNKKLFYFTGEYLGDDGNSPVYKEYGKLHYTEFTPPTIQFIADNPKKWKQYEFDATKKAEVLKAKERLKELKRCAKLGELAPQYMTEIETLSAYIKTN